VATSPGAFTGAGIRSRHISLSYQLMDPVKLAMAVEWTRVQVESERSVLVRSERGLQRPALVVALVVIELGGKRDDAINAVKHARIGALTDFRYLKILTDAADAGSRS
jgi:hypothetical protein